MKGFSERFNRIDRYGVNINTHDLVKLFAILSMSVAHISYCLYPDAIYPNFLWVRALGRVTVPALFFLIGFSKNHSVSNYFALLAIGFQVMCVSTFYPVFPLNILFSVIVCRVFLKSIRRFSATATINIAFIVFFIGLVPNVYVATCMVYEYGIHALQFALMGYLVRMAAEGNDIRFVTAGYSLLIGLFYVYVQNYEFEFNEYQAAFVWIIMTVLMVGLFFYRVRTFNCFKNKPRVAFCIKLLSRYSLEYYVIHRTILQIMSLWINLDHTHDFKWLYL